MDDLNTVLICALCKGGAGVHLKTCTAWKHIKYCSVTCQRRHCPKDKKQDCPSCFLTMPFACHEVAVSLTWEYCVPGVCLVQLVIRKQTVWVSKFWFCNVHPVPKTECNRIEQMKKRGEANNANAHYSMQLCPWVNWFAFRWEQVVWILDSCIVALVDWGS